ncbi:MAG TPA: protease inhibitor I42 family protein [Bryobacteraceae bacterium]|nr:protease inhibitor I42 family protein [Bryobacteraceae bacterium]
MRAVVFLLAGTLSGAQIGPRALWQPGMQFMQEVHARCDRGSSYPTFGDCFVAHMTLTGAPPEAVAFAKMTGNQGFLRDFRAAGRVSVAYAVYPFRANENQVWLLVNGSPPMVDVDDLQQLPQDALKADPAYAAVAQKFPDASLWPGDRSGTGGPVVVAFGDGGQQFVVEYRVRNLCHACAVLGYAFYGFRFHRRGDFEGPEYLGFTPGNELTVPAAPLAVKAGEQFTVSLPSNRTTGYRWIMAGEPARDVVRLVREEYKAPGRAAAGAGGEERWTFQAVGPGSAKWRMLYARPWEKPARPGKELALAVRVK